MINFKTKWLAGITVFSIGMIILGSMGHGAAAAPTLLSMSKVQPDEELKAAIGSGGKFKVQQEIKLLPGDEIAFQDGALTKEVGFFSTPHCYIKTRAGGQPVSIPQGKTLKVTKIESNSKHGSGSVVFQFDDSVISSIRCVTDYDHGLSLNELKHALGNYFNVEISKGPDSPAVVGDYAALGAEFGK
ncbi:MAG: hypothetical protein ACXWP5_05610 [Bdellovibrionota bacterium]